MTLSVSALSRRFATLFCTLIVAGAAADVAEAKNKNTLPPHWRQWLKTCAAEQPKPGGWGTWGRINWRHGGSGITYPGGCGFTRQNWNDHKRPGQPETMDQASPLEQLWACERIYTYYLRQSGSHRYAATVWAANRTIGFRGFSDEEWRRPR
jgi:hypothetical protein